MGAVVVVGKVPSSALKKAKKCRAAAVLAKAVQRYPFLSAGRLVA